MSIEDKLLQLGITLPEPPAPMAMYVPCVRTGNWIFVSGQVPRENGALKFRGHVGGDLSMEDGVNAARLCALNALSILRKELGDLDRIRRVVKITGYVSSAAGFHHQPEVINGASKLLVDLFGEKGQHARAAVGVSELPAGVAVEVEMMVEVEG